MKSHAPTILSLLLALTFGKLNLERKPTIVTWLIDGTNLQCCSASGGKGRMERHQVVDEIQSIASPSGSCLSLEELPKTQSKKRGKKHKPIANVVLVFDGNEDEDFQELILDRWFRVIITDGNGRKKDRADDYIVDHALPKLDQRFPIDGEADTLHRHHHYHVVHLVSADKELRRRARATRMMNGGSLVHPPKFWKQYLPNLQQEQQE